MAQQVYMAHVTINQAGDKARMFYKDSWGKRYYSFDQRVWETKKSLAFNKADKLRLSFVAPQGA